MVKVRSECPRSEHKHTHTHRSCARTHGRPQHPDARMRTDNSEEQPCGSAPKVALGTAPRRGPEPRDALLQRTQSSGKRRRGRASEPRTDSAQREARVALRERPPPPIRTRLGTFVAATRMQAAAKKAVGLTLATGMWPCSTRLDTTCSLGVRARLAARAVWGLGFRV